MTRTVEQAQAYFARQSAQGPRFPVDECQKQCHDGYLIPSDGTPTAAAWWAKSKHRHPTSDPSTAPRGAFHYFTGGSSGAGHVMVSKGGSPSWSTDIKRAGYFDETTVEHVLATWPRLRYVGWTEDIDSVRVLTAGPPDWHPSTGKLPIDVLDLSHWNKVTAAGFAKAIRSGAKDIYLKATEGTTFVDPTYATRRNLVNSYGGNVGAYHYGLPKESSGTTQAKHFLSVAKLKRGRDLRVMLDLEPGEKNENLSGLTRAQITKWVGHFVAEVERQLGSECWGLIYTSVDLDDAFGWKLWVARYSNSNALPRIPAPFDRWLVRQFSNGVYGNPKTVPGISGVDLSNVVGPVSVLKLPALPPPPPPPPPPAAPSWVVTQANVQETDSLPEILRRIHTVAEGTSDGATPPDVIVWNELGGKHQKLVHAAVKSALPGFESYIVEGVGISWRTSVFVDVGRGSRIVNKGVAHFTPDRPLIYVDLSHLAARKGYRQEAGHSVHHVEDKGLPRIKGALLGQNRRARRYFAAIADDFRAAKATHRPCVFEGDLNVDLLAELRLPAAKRCKWFPLTVLDAVGRIKMPHEGTHGRRAIDWNVVAGAIYVLASKVLPHGSSDHNAVQHELSFERST